MNDIVFDIINSWSKKDGINSSKFILDWIKHRNENLKVKIEKTTLSKLSDWFLDSKTGVIHNHDDSFFSIHGFQEIDKFNNLIEQPIIVQDEIGFLGIICKKIDGILYFLMQAKIEPGNINKIQISPTIQATKSNFEQKHHGKKPLYLDYFINANKYITIVDQIESEQASRFYKKRNRNIVILVDSDIQVFDSFCWMTLGQIKELMSIDNLVNMDTRTVLSCLPIYNGAIDSYIKYKRLFKDEYLYNSMFNNDEGNLCLAFQKLNNFKMFNNYSSNFCSLYNLSSWNVNESEIFSNESKNFEVIFCNLEIEGREVKKWSQPLLEAYGKALFVLFAKKVNGKYNFLIKIKHEIGSFDKCEFGPTIQKEYSEVFNNDDLISKVYLSHFSKNKGFIKNVVLSEEGGRFYQEENINQILLIDDDEVTSLTNDFVWVDYKTLNLMIQFNNIVNIQLRNLISLLEV